MSRRFHGKVTAPRTLTLAPVIGSTGNNVLALHEALVCKRVSTTTADIDADGILLRTTIRGEYFAESVNLTVDITASGVNGLDTGSEASSTWYNLWVIYDGETVAGLLSTASTVETITFPSDYIYAGLVGSIFNNSSSDFIDYNQLGNSFYTGEAAQLSNGSATSPTSISLITGIPPIAKIALGFSHVDAAGTGSSLLTIQSSSSSTVAKIEILNSGVAANAKSGGYWELPMITAQTIFYFVNGASEDGTIVTTGGRY